MTDKLVSFQTPWDAQKFLNTQMVYDHKRLESDTYLVLSPVEAIKHGKVICVDAALIALYGLPDDMFKTILLTHNMKARKKHAAMVFKTNGKFGAVSKSRNLLNEWRDPIYPNLDTLARSYGVFYYGTLDVPSTIHDWKDTKRNIGYYFKGTPEHRVKLWNMIRK